MAKVVEVHINGLDEICDKLEHLPINASRRIMRRSLKDAGQIWLDEMKARVRQGEHHFKDKTTEFGVIAKNIIMRVSARSDVSGYVRVGVRERRNDPKSPFWALFVEFGTAVRKRGGKMPAFPFARPAFESKKKEVLDTFLVDVKKNINEVGLKLQ